jgi:serine/threonine protein kinase
MTGTMIGRYELLEKLGEGGMGVVYRARDVLLNRFVALKFLPDAGLDDDRKRRFLQEAQVASSLNHPNIVTIYEVSLDPPREFIAMEYVKGRPLDALIGTAGLPFNDVLTYAIQIADALAAAHAVGIVHRDVKPGNVLISDTGIPKVLDFGLAKLIDHGPLTTDEAARTVTIGSAQRTREGAIVGTVSYMSPEQAEGKPVDHRSDIFSFGAMLYEMLTGKRAFIGDSAVSTLAAILRAETPDVTQQLPGTPPEFNRVLRRCLEKSAERRWQSMADVRAILEDIRQEPRAGQSAPIAPSLSRPPSRSRAWIYTTAGIAIVTLGAFATLRSRPSETPAQTYTFRRITSDTASNVAPTLSPDGKVIAYSSDRSQSGAADIWIQQVAGGEPVRLTSSLGLCHSPVFSPDGSRIAFHGGPDARGIYVVSTFGGEARRIADGRNPSFSPDGSQVSYMGSTNDRIMLIPAMGGTPRELPLKHGVNGRPQWLPDGKRLLFLGVDGKSAFDWYSVPAAGGEEKSCGASKWLHDPFDRAAPSSLFSSGALIFVGESDSANVYRIPFDMAEARVTGAPVPVTMAPGVSFWPSASADGTRIVFGNSASFNTNLWAMNVDAASGAVTGEPRAVTGGLNERTAPYPSPDGKRIAYKSNSGRSQEIRVLEVATGQEVRIAEASAATPPVISDDGTQVAYAVREKGGMSIYAAPVTGGVPRRLCTDCGRPTEWFGRGTRILYDQASKNTEITVLDVASGKSTTILRSRANRIYTPRLSPNRRLLCFTLINGNRQRITHVVPFSESGLIPEEQWKPLTVNSPVDERQPFWSPDGRLIYVISERDGFRCVWATRFDPAALKVIGEPFPAHHLHQYRHSLLDFDDPADIGLSLAGKTMFLAVREFQATIWLAERKPAQTP